MLTEKRLKAIEDRATLMQYSGTNPDYKPTEYEMRPCSTMQDVHDLIAEVKRLRPVVEAAMELMNAEQLRHEQVTTAIRTGVIDDQAAYKAVMAARRKLREKLAALAGEKGETDGSR